MKLSNVDASRLLLALIILLIVTGIATAIFVFRSNPIQEAIASNRVLNVLFVIEHEKQPVSTYVLMYYPGTGRAAIFDIPGELGLLLSRINRVDRIDRVYDSARIGNFQNEIERLLAININFSIVITKENLTSMVDLLEGVQIFIPSSVNFRDENNFVLFPSGMTILDGDKAATYATYSLPNEDREVQVFRRQRFFIGLLDRWIRMNDSFRNRDAAKLYFSFFKTSMNQRTLIRLFDEFTKIDTGRTNIQNVGGSLREVSGQMLIIPHWDGNLVKEVVRQTLETLTRELEGGRRSLTVEVLNGTAITGFAGRTAETLRSLGHDVVSVGNAERNTFERTVIIHRSGDDELVNLFADVIRCTNIRREFEDYGSPEDQGSLHNNDTEADITLIIGRDFNGRFVTGN